MPRRKPVRKKAAATKSHRDSQVNALVTENAMLLRFLTAMMLRFGHYTEDEVVCLVAGQVRGTPVTWKRRGDAFLLSIETEQPVEAPPEEGVIASEEHPPEPPDELDGFAASLRGDGES